MSPATPSNAITDTCIMPGFYTPRRIQTQISMLTQQVLCSPSCLPTPYALHSSRLSQAHQGRARTPSSLYQSHHLPCLDFLYGSFSFCTVGTGGIESFSSLGRSQSKIVTWGSHCSPSGRIWKDLEGSGRVWKDLGGSGRIWKDLEGEVQRGGWGMG